jgi:hypothetical protein
VLCVVLFLQGAYRPHQLKNADITCSSLTELSVINLRRMFANMGHEHMDLMVGCYSLGPSYNCGCTLLDSNNGLLHGTCQVPQGVWIPANAMALHGECNMYFCCMFCRCLRSCCGG